MSLGWLTESSLMPKRAKEIEQVGKSTMVDLRAQLYRSEESLKHTEGGASAAAVLVATMTASLASCRAFIWICAARRCA